MGKDSKIEWCHHTLNPWRGCTKATWTGSDGKTRLHPGCLNCYAEVDMSVKLHGIKWGKGQERRPKADSGWKEPLKWARAAANAGERHRVFCASLADVLDPEVPDSMRERLWPIIEDTAWMCGGCGRPCTHSTDTPHRAARLLDLDSVGAACEGVNGRCLNNPMGGLDFLLLTKRPEEWQRVPAWVRPLVWLGTSVSDQETADEWVPRLLKAEGFRYLFLSVEPLVGPLDLTRWIERIDHCGACGAENEPQKEDRCLGCGRSLVSTWGHDEAERYRSGERYSTAAGARDVAGQGGIHWIIVGGESGSKARPCNVEWIRSIVRQCREAGVPCHVKQLGRVPIFEDPATDDTVFMKDHKGGDWDEWPADLRVREFPSSS